MNKKKIKQIGYINVMVLCREDIKGFGIIGLDDEGSKNLRNYN